jgi:hypothetical protein
LVRSQLPAEGRSSDFAHRQGFYGTAVKQWDPLDQPSRIEPGKLL